MRQNDCDEMGLEGGSELQVTSNMLWKKEKKRKTKKISDTEHGEQELRAEKIAGHAMHERTTLSNQRLSSRLSPIRSSSPRPM